MNTSARGQSGLLGWLGLLAWLAVGLLMNVAGAQAATAATTSTDPSLVGYWTFNDGAGSSAADSSGSGNTASLRNSPTWVSGQIGGALNFDGTSQSAQVANVAGLGSGNTPHTVAAWVKVNALPANRAWILLLGNAGGGAHHWLLNNNGSTQLGSWGGGQVQPSLTVGRWTHIALTFDGTTLTGYINGTAIGAIGASFNLSGTPLTLAQAYLGENNFNGQVDDLHIYNRALSAAEVSGLASATATPPSVSLTAPTSGATYTAPASITLNATAAETGGTIAKVEFYNGTTLLGTATAAPYSYTWSSVAPGSYTLTAKAYDTLNAITTSSPVTVNVGAAPGAADPSLVAYWKLDDGSGSTALDSSGSGNNATLRNSPTWVNGQIGGALNFDGTSQSASVANVIGLGSGNTPHTVAAWVKVNALPANRAWILLLGNAGGGAHHWLLNNNGSTQLGSWGGGQVNPSLTVGQWTHIAVTFDGTTLTGYINGTAIGAIGASFNLSGIPLTLAQAYLGENNFNGQVDDLHVYNRALSAAEVSGLASATATPPSVSLTAPTSGATYTAPASITLSATAAETGGTISKVEFYNGTTLLGTATAAPYTVTLANVTAGSYTYTAKAYDSTGTSTTSTAVTITVNAASAAPSVSLTAPTNNQTYTAPASITLNATATETGGTISRVDFYSGASLLGAATAAPYTYTWTNVPAGSYTFTAVATDTNNVSTTSSPVSVSVGAAAVTQIYYIYTDQLDTPRLITDSANSVVWRNDQADPFNASAPYDDPGNTGHHFVFNLRFPGQYYDQETGLAYNYYRDYDANTGRYVQSDPIGLAGGMNTYAYVGGAPVSRIDPRGLSAAVAGRVTVKCLLNPVCRAAAAAVATAAVAKAGQMCSNGIDKVRNWMANEEAHKEAGGENTNPYDGPVDVPVVVVDSKGNAIPVDKGQSVNTSPNGDYQQVIGADGEPTGDRLDRGGHRGQRDPAAQGPHAHRPGYTTQDGNPHLPIY